MKLEVGMYAYNKTDRKQGIGKIVCLQEYNNANILYKKSVKLISIGNIIASHDITDLIEDRDFVEIEFYSLRYEKRVIRIFEVGYKDEEYINFENMHCDLQMINGEWSNSDKELEPAIKSIVTKEQFESMKYEV